MMISYVVDSEDAVIFFLLVGNCHGFYHDSLLGMDPVSPVASTALYRSFPSHIDHHLIYILHTYLFIGHI